MILFVNGDSNSAGAEAVNPCCWISDDPKYWEIVGEEKYRGHPDNLAVSYGKIISDKLNYEYINHASAAASNSKILRTTYKYLEHNKPDFIIIGWASWEREEWFNEEDGVYYQVNASGADSVPSKWTTRYKNFVINCGNTIHLKAQADHEKIYELHCYLLNLQIKHLFFNCHATFHNKVTNFYDWQNCYIEPYSEFNYIDYLLLNDYKHNKWWHFGADGHAKWAEFLLPHLTALL